MVFSYDGRSSRSVAGQNTSVVDALARQGADEIACRLASWPADAEVMPDVPASVQISTGSKDGMEKQKHFSTRLAEMLDAQQEELQSIRLQLWKQATDGIAMLSAQNSRPHARNDTNPHVQLQLPIQKRFSYDGRLPPITLRESAQSRVSQDSALRLPLPARTDVSTSDVFPKIETPNISRNADLLCPGSRCQSKNSSNHHETFNTPSHHPWD